MTIERSHRPFWFARTTSKEIGSGFIERFRPPVFGNQDFVEVINPDRLRVSINENTHLECVKFYNKEEINEGRKEISRWQMPNPPFIGRRITYSWKPSPENK